MRYAVTESWCGIAPSERSRGSGFTEFAGMTRQEVRVRRIAVVVEMPSAASVRR